MNDGPTARARGVGRTIGCVALLAFLAGVRAPAKESPLATGTMEVSGFRVPDYDETGRLRAQLFGGHAKFLDDDRVEITDLKIELYKDGELSMTLYAPQCIFDTTKKTATSDGEVLAESESMTTFGRGFFWSAGAQRFEIFHEAKVLVKPAARTQAKELEQ